METQLDNIALTGSTTLKQLLEAFGRIENFDVESQGRKYLNLRLTVDASAKPVNLGTSPNADDKALAMKKMPAEFAAMLTRYDGLCKAEQEKRNAGKLVNRWTIKVNADRLISL